MAPSTESRPKIIFEDDVLLIVNKPAGLVVHPAPSVKGPTLVDWIREYLGPKAVADFAEPDRLGLVHRLDKDTSGVLVVTKTPEAKTLIGKQFHDRLIHKQYVAFVQGVPPKMKGLISAPIGRSLQVPTRMAITGSGRPSETSFEVLESFKEVSLMMLFPKTGRTHQIRVHCAAIGHPVVGDRTYGASEKWSRDFGIQRPLLHALKLEFAHPVTGKRVKYEAPWPADMKKARTVFKKIFHALWVLALVSPLHAAPEKKKTTATPSGTASSSTPAKSTTPPGVTRKELNALKEQFKVLIEEVSALQDRLSAIQTKIDDMGGARRLNELEKAISDLNGKAVSTASVTEENKSQVLDMSRKVKSQQEMLEQLRDQVDRLQRESIQSRSREEGAPPVSQREPTP